MASDKRYAISTEVPDALLNNDVDREYSIRGQFREGRAAYLDMSSTTPLDPRVLDSMLPYMVRSCSLHLAPLSFFKTCTSLQ
jgi:hypothetical protein